MFNVPIIFWFWRKYFYWARASPNHLGMQWPSLDSMHIRTAEDSALKVNEKPSEMHIKNTTDTWKFTLFALPYLRTENSKQHLFINGTLKMIFLQLFWMKTLSFIYDMLFFPFWKISSLKTLSSEWRLSLCLSFCDSFFGLLEDFELFYQCTSTLTERNETMNSRTKAGVWVTKTKLMSECKDTYLWNMV